MENWCKIGEMYFNVNDIECIGALFDNSFAINFKSGHHYEIKQGHFPGKDIKVVRQRLLALIPDAKDLLDGIESTAEFVVLRSKAHGEMIYVNGEPHKSGDPLTVEEIQKEATKYGVDAVRYMDVTMYNELVWDHKRYFWPAKLPNEYKTEA